jgi:hypothetical protein
MQPGATLAHCQRRLTNKAARATARVAARIAEGEAA